MFSFFFIQLMCFVVHLYIQLKTTLYQSIHNITSCPIGHQGSLWDPDFIGGSGIGDTAGEALGPSWYHVLIACVSLSGVD